MIASVFACMLLAAPALAADGSGTGGGGMYGEMDMGTNTGCNTTILEVGLAIPELSTLAILQLHLFLGGLLSTELTDGMVVATVGVSDDGITFTSTGGAVAKVLQADFIACASALHVVDTLLL